MAKLLPALIVLFLLTGRPALAEVAAPAPRVIDMTVKLMNLEGTQPLKDKDDPVHLEATSANPSADPQCGRCRDMTLGHLSAEALYASPDAPQPPPGQQRVTPEQEFTWGLQRAARGEWAKTIENNPAAQLTDPQAALLDRLIAELQIPGYVIAQAHTILQPNTPLPDVK